MADNPTASTSQPIPPAGLGTTSAGGTNGGITSAPAGNVSANGSNAGPGAAAGRSMMGSPPDMHLDTQTGKWMFEDPQTGQEFEWNEAANAWLPVVEDDLVKQQQAAYSVAGVDESAPTTSLLSRDRKKRKREEAGEDGSVKAGSSKKAGKQKAGKRNTAVFIQHLPLDATIDEVNSVFSKAGLILVDADDKPKIKLYEDAKTGMRNGDGLVVFYKEESVQLAINLLDESPLRLGDKENMRVAKAEWSHKKEEEEAGENGDGKGKQSRVDPNKAQKMQKRAERLQREAADYDPSYDERESPAYLAANAATKSTTGGRIVVLAHVFTLEELAEDASLLLDLKEDIREECESIGKVTNVVLYDREPEGIVTVKFTDPIAAQACVIKNNNRFFGGRQLKAWIFDGKTRYRKSGFGEESAPREGETAEEAEKRRLEEFGQWLEVEDA